MQNGAIFHSMADQESVSAVSLCPTSFRREPKTCLLIGAHYLIVDFALTEVAYTVVRLIQEFQTIKLPKGEPVELAGLEKQTMTLVMSSTRGCKVELQ
jgi:hypothetical protein